MKKRILAIFITGLSCVSVAHGKAIPENDKTALKLFFSASSPTENLDYIPPLPELSLFRAKVVAPKSCKGNIGLSISNAFTDGTIKKIFENFDSIMKSIVSTEGGIFLASIYVSKSNPQLYQLITEGIDMTLTDFLSAMGSCEAVAQSLVSVAGDPVIDMQRQTQLNKLIEANAKTAIDKEWNDVKVEEILRSGAERLAENGITIFNGITKGGKNQPALDVVRDTLKYGWCIYRGFTEKQCEAQFNDGNDSKELIGIAKNDRQIFNSEKELNRLAIMIIGNKYLSLCNGCESISVSGQGVNAYIDEQQKIIFQQINKLSEIKIREITEDQFETVSKPPSIIADANYFRNLALLDNDMDVRNMYAMGWAYDVAYQRASTLLDHLENALNGAKSSPTIDKAGLLKEIERSIEQVKNERGYLERHAKRNNYTPKMYVRALLGVSRRLSDGNTPLGIIGETL